MLSKFEDGKKSGDDLVSEANDGSKSIEKTRFSSPKSKHKHRNEDSSRKDKKSIWSWRALKALSNIGNRKFKCCFTLQVHSIKELPSNLDNISLYVHWKRRDEEMITCPSKVSQGIAEFEEKLMHTCSVYGSSSGSQNVAKYEGKHFVLYASVFGAPEHDLGKHRVDLTRLLPLTLEDLEDEKSEGMWTTSYKLSGKAKGAIMNVSFGYFVIGDNRNDDVSHTMSSKQKNPNAIGSQHVGSFPNAVEEIKDLHEVVPTSKSELANSVSMADQKLDEDKLVASIDYKLPDVQLLSDSGNEDTENECQEDNACFVVEHGVELSSNEHEKLVQAKVVSDAAAGDFSVESRENDGYELYTEESLLEEFESALTSVSNLGTAAIDSPEDQESYLDVMSSYKTNTKVKSRSLNDESELVATEFLHMLRIEHSPFNLSSDSEPESPRELLLKQFEKDQLAAGGSLFDFDIRGDLSNDHEAIEDHQCKTRAKILEDLETKFLMREWGLNEKAFQYSPPNGSLRRPNDLSSEKPLELPPIGEGFGPCIQTNKGGFVRSMDPSLFRNATSGESLVMQVSCPVVLPAEMGSDVMEILQRLASIGIEKLSVQANKLMPLEDVAGKSMQQIAWEAGVFEGIERQCMSQHEVEVRKDDARPGSNSSSMGSDMGSEYVALEDLAPFAMDKIEALSIEGLRIQSGMSDNDVPSNISTHDTRGSLGLEGAAGLRLLDIIDKGDEVDGLMGPALTLEEWSRLDSGEIHDEGRSNERTYKVLAAHHATSLDLIRGDKQGERRRGKGRSQNCGLLGNNFTVSSMMQLHNPLQNYDLVGAPMLALIQVERVFISSKQKIYSTVSDTRSRNEEDNESELMGKEIRQEKQFEQERIPRVKIREVHVVGLKTEPGKKKLWGSKVQQQSGSRWLLANGMGKSNKHPLLKSKAVSKTPVSMTTKVQHGDSLWSISSRVQGTGLKWKELGKLNPHIRKP